MNIDYDISSILDGAIDSHIHFSPDGMAERKKDAFEVLKEAKLMKMKAVVLKNKTYGTGAISQLANKYIKGITAIGSVTLDTSIGGFNPEYVEIEAKLGSKVVWMPTYSAANDPTLAHKGKNVLMIWDENYQINPSLIEIMHIIKRYNMVLATGHISRNEVFKLLEISNEIGIEKFVVTHPLTKSVGTLLSISDQINLVEMGAFIEHTWCATMPKNDNIDPSLFTKAIQAVGVENCILSTDLGQVYNVSPSEGFVMMIKTMLQEGFSEKEISIMIKAVPEKLFDIDSYDQR